MVAGRGLGHTLAGEGVHFWIGIAETGKGGLIPHFILPTVVNSVGYAFPPTKCEECVLVFCGIRHAATVPWPEKQLMFRISWSSPTGLAQRTNPMCFRHT